MHEQGRAGVTDVVFGNASAKRGQSVFRDIPTDNSITRDWYSVGYLQEAELPLTHEYRVP